MTHKRISPYIWIPITLLMVALFATTDSSFWIDECVTSKYAIHPKLSDAWHDVLKDNYAEVQMPLYICYIWGFEKIFGHSELALRLAGLPFFLIGMTLLVSSIQRRLKFHWPILYIISFSPFLWYYLNEARLYSMQLGITALVAASLFRLHDANGKQTESRWLKTYLIGIVTLSGISLLSQIWSGSAILVLFVIIPKRRLTSWWCDHKGKILVTGTLLLLLGFYYLWTLKNGARATDAGTTNLQTILSIFYEELGFIGLGPGRTELREIGPSALLPYALVLVIYAIFSGIVILASFVKLSQRHVRSITLGTLICILIPASFILLAGIITHFRVLGRHFAPFEVIILILLSIGVQQLFQSYGRIGKACASGFLILTLISCLQIRFAQRHKKDDYRQASMHAKAALAHEKIVWWNASEIGAVYYGVPIQKSDQSEDKGVLVLSDPFANLSTALRKPDVVITSKQDIFDKNHKLENYLRENTYHKIGILNAFTIWEKAESLSH